MLSHRTQKNSHVQGEDMVLGYGELIALLNNMISPFSYYKIIYDKNGDPMDYEFICVNEAFERETGMKRELVIGKRVLEVFPSTEKYWIQKLGRVAQTGIPDHFTDYAGALKKWYSISAYSPKPDYFAMTVHDVTQTVKYQNELLKLIRQHELTENDLKSKKDENEYLIYFDVLTGLHNRIAYEEELARINNDDNYPVAFLMCDVNGLKLINDSLGYVHGDEALKKAAKVLINACRKNDFIARVGGDEFAVIMPMLDEDGVLKAVNAIKESCREETIGGVELSISCGYQILKEKGQSIPLTLANAENHMFRHKLNESSSMRSETVSIIMKALFEKSKREMRHSKRVSDICESIAIQLKLDDDEIKQIRTAGLMHDIGKIGIDEKILNKKRKLDESEWIEMRHHPEAGWRILSSIPEFVELAGFVLEHHERWDGKGYPKGIKGKQISMQARIIAIADAYDAMTSDRPYRKSTDKQAAIGEIWKNSGKQFDPEMVEAFARI